MATQQNPSSPQPGHRDAWHDDVPPERPDEMVPPAEWQSPSSPWRGDPAWSAAWEAATPAPTASPGDPNPAPGPTPPATTPPAVPDVAPAASPTLGVMSFALVTSMTVVCLVFAYLLGGDMGSLLVSVGGTTFDPTNLGRSSQQVSLRVILGFLAAVLGCVGWIMSIVAYNRRSARSLSLAAIIVGLIVPMLAFIALLMAAGPYVHRIPR